MFYLSFGGRCIKFFLLEFASAFFGGCEGLLRGWIFCMSDNAFLFLGKARIWIWNRGLGILEGSLSDRKRSILLVILGEDGFLGCGFWISLTYLRSNLMFLVRDLLVLGRMVDLFSLHLIIILIFICLVLVFLDDIFWRKCRSFDLYWFFKFIHKFGRSGSIILW